MALEFSVVNIELTAARVCRVHALISFVLFLMRFPTLSLNQVATVLLSCAFFYDIFWVFFSKKIFHESVMIVVSICIQLISLSAALSRKCARLFELQVFRIIVTKNLEGMGWNWTPFFFVRTLYQPMSLSNPLVEQMKACDLFDGLSSQERKPTFLCYRLPVATEVVRMESRCC